MPVECTVLVCTPPCSACPCTLHECTPACTVPSPGLGPGCKAAWSQLDVHPLLKAGQQPGSSLRVQVSGCSGGARDQLCDVNISDRRCFRVEGGCKQMGAGRAFPKHRGHWDSRGSAVGCFTPSDVLQMFSGTALPPAPCQPCEQLQAWLQPSLPPWWS